MPDSLSLRTRLAWSFVAMLVVPALAIMVLGALVRWWWDPSAGDRGWAGQMGQRTLSELNTLLIDQPDSLLTEPGFRNLDSLLPQGVNASIRVDGRLVRGEDPARYETSGSENSHHHGNKLLLSWRFRLSDGTIATLDLHMDGKELAALWGGWFLGGSLGLIAVVVLTNGVLTWRIGRSVVQPLKHLEQSVLDLGEGNLASPIQSRGSPEFRRLGEALDGLRLRLRDSLAERESLEEERRTWVASVSHDLRTPLAALRAHAEALRDGMARTPERTDRYHQVILERALHMESLLDDLFQWARWDWGSPQLHLKSLDLTGEVHHALSDWENDSPDLVIVRDIPQAFEDSARAAIVADPLAIRRIVDNLLRNALQHGGRGTVMEVSVRLPDPGWIEVRFQDNGPGIAPDLHEKVFERFFRGDPARTPAKGGGGLGLTIGRTLAEAMGGTLTVIATDKPGACLRLRLPAAGGEGNP